MAGKDYLGAFSKWAGRKMPSDVRNFANWGVSEATSHPLNRLGTALRGGDIPPVEMKEVIPAPASSYKPASGSRNVKVPEMLKSKYWRPGVK